MKKLALLLLGLLLIPNMIFAVGVQTATMYEPNSGDQKIVEVGSPGIWAGGWRLQTPNDSISYWVDRLMEGNLSQSESLYVPNKAIDLVTPKIIQIIPREDVFGGETEPEIITCRGSECDQYLANEVDDQFGYSVISRYKTTLRSSISSTQATIPVSSMTTFDDHVIVQADYGVKAFLVIEPGSSREEIVKATSNSTTNWTGVTRGLAFYGTTETSVAANRKAHNAGSIIVMSNTHYVYEQLIDKDTNQTLTGDFTVASSTDDDIQTIIYGTSTPSSLINEDGVLYYCNYGASCAAIGAGANTYNFIQPLITDGSDIKIATTTYEWDYNSDNALSNATSTISNGTASGTGLDDWLNSRLNATSTQANVFTFSDGFASNASSTIYASATTTESHNVGELGFNGADLKSYWPVSMEYASSSDAIIADNTYGFQSFTTRAMGIHDAIFIRAFVKVSGSGDGNSIYLTADGVTTTDPIVSNYNGVVTWDFWLQNLGATNKNSLKAEYGNLEQNPDGTQSVFTTTNMLKTTSTIDTSDGVEFRLTNLGSGDDVVQNSFVIELHSY